MSLRCRAAGLALALALPTALFWPVLRGDFLALDDHDYISAAAGQGWGRIFTTSILGYYHPLTVASFKLEYSLAGPNPKVYHATNLSLHAADCALVYWLMLLLGLDVPAALFAALLFACHPSRVQAVAWISSRKELLCCLFFVAALLSYLRYLGARALGWLAGSAALFAASSLSKPTMFCGPLILLLLDWRAGRRDVRSALLEKILFVAAPLGVAAASVRLGDFLPFTLHAPTVSGCQRLALCARGFWYYAEKTFLPINISIPYQLLRPRSMTASDFLFPALGAALYGFLLAVRPLRTAGQCAVFFGVALLPVLIFPGLTPADRYLYIPSIGIFCAAGAVFAWAYGKAKVPALLAATALLGACLWSDRTRLKYWGDDVGFWSGVIAKTAPHLRAEGDERSSPQGAFDRTALAVAYLKRGEAHFWKSQFAEAVADDAAAIEATSGSADLLSKAYNNRGVTYCQIARFEQALGDFNESLKLAPRDAKIYANRGLAFIKLKRPQRASADFEAALSLDPSWKPALAGRCLIQAREPERCPNPTLSLE